MGSIGKFILGSAVVGAVAAGVYYYLDKTQRHEEAEPLGEEENHETGTDKVLNAASRAYTTIKHGTNEAINSVKKTVGPKGSEVMDVVGGAAVKVKDVVADSAVKVKDIVTAKNDDYVTAPRAEKEAEEAEEEAVSIPVTGGEDEEPERPEAAGNEEQEPAEEAEKAEAPSENGEENADLQEDPAAARKADEVEEFFDDDAKD